MKSTKNISAIDFTALAKLTMDNKHAGIIAMLAIESSDKGIVSITNKALVEATGMDRKSVRVAMDYLQASRALIKDLVVKDIFHINSRLVSTHDPRTLRDADFFPEFSAKIDSLKCIPKPSRSDMREVERMNKLTDADIADCFAA
ncbi:hypothetical protein GCM10009104_25680 [Marinobacterium maritimum]|uniref:Plasmid replication protein RepL domain-containing protein n=1 Tax=Marinobacterium maritimum TaxID=500162 RepID=A0ABN1I895_9GAMM